MDNWFKRIFLRPGNCFLQTLASGLATALLYTALAGPVMAAEPDGKPEAVQVIQPEVQPREIEEAQIDDESFEIGLYAGVISIEDFGSEPVIGVKASYFTTEDLFLQLNYGVSKAGKTSFEELSVDLLNDSERDYTYYNFLVGYNIFPGEVFVTSKLAFNSSFYLVGGVGNTEFADEDNFTITLGTGFRIVVNDWLTWHIDYRDHIFRTDIITENQLTHNMELSTGLTVFF